MILRINNSIILFTSEIISDNDHWYGDNWSLKLFVSSFILFHKDQKTQFYFAYTRVLNSSDVVPNMGNGLIKVIFKGKEAWT